MALTEQSVNGPAQDDPRPLPRPRSRADLVETADGWVLTLVLDAATAAHLRAELSEELSSARVLPDDFRVSVRPNLVPGTPFKISAIDVVVDGAG